MTESAGKTALIIPTLNAGTAWGQCLASAAQQSLKLHRKLIIDSTSSDGTVVQASAAGFEVKVIRRAEFNHGRTRQWAAEYLSDCDFLVFMTQDAILASPDSLGNLLRCLESPRAAVAYGRQLPRQNATAIEAHARLFNYGEDTQLKELSCRPRLGAKIFFCSNSFAAYRRAILLELGGFRTDLILGEDAEFAARAVLAGYLNVYCAQAAVYHSHDYSAAQLLSRYFDTGVFHIRNDWLRKEFGSYRGEGLRFLSSELRFLATRAPSQIPRSIAQALAKVVGYQLGRQEKRLPRALKRRLSMTPGYWQ